MSGLVISRLRAATALICLASLLPPAAAVPKPHKQTPLRFDPPAAGPAQRGNAGYEACIDTPGPDGAVMDCQALLRPVAAAKPRHRSR